MKPWCDVDRSSVRTKRDGKRSNKHHNTDSSRAEMIQMIDPLNVNLLPLPAKHLGTMYNIPCTMESDTFGCICQHISINVGKTTNASCKQHLVMIMTLKQANKQAPAWRFESSVIHHPLSLTGSHVGALSLQLLVLCFYLKQRHTASWCQTGSHRQLMSNRVTPPADVKQRHTASWCQTGSHRQLMSNSATPRPPFDVKQGHTSYLGRGRRRQPLQEWA